MANFPKTVSFQEAGPREGFQIEKNFVPTARKIQFINALSKTGLKTIQIVSFVNPKLVPNMADAEQVVAGIDLQPGVEYKTEGFVMGLVDIDQAIIARFAIVGHLH